MWIDEIAKQGVEIKKSQKEKFDQYTKLLVEWNEKINLTSITEQEDIEIKHYMDSLLPLGLEEVKNAKTVLDIGTGAGFPGIPLKIIDEEKSFVLLDSLNKRIKFLNLVIEELELKEIKAIHGRAEEFSRKEEYREKFDLVISRAVARLNTLSEYAIPFVKVGGYFIAMKSEEIDEEVKESQKSIKTLGAEFKEIKKISIPGTEIVRSFVVIKKIKATLTKYPRGQGKPKSKPL